MFKRYLLPAYAALLASACGQDRKPVAETKPEVVVETNVVPNDETADKARLAASTSMAQQSLLAVTEAADFAAIIGHNSYDNGGATAPTPLPTAQVGVTRTPIQDATGRITASQVELRLMAAPYGAGTLDGNVTARLVQNDGNDGSLVEDGNVTFALQFAYGRSNAAGAALQVQSGDNVAVLQRGSRAGGEAVRSLMGTQQRLLAALGASGDYTLDLNGASVRDLYDNVVLRQRTVGGTTTLLAADGARAWLKYDLLVFSAPSTCRCPSSGTLKVGRIFAGDLSSTDYTFTATCGVVEVSGFVAGPADEPVAIRAQAMTWPGCMVASP